MGDPLLWTIQSRDGFRDLLKNGQPTGRPPGVSADGWAIAYKWMKSQMLRRGIPIGEHRPIWAWHSCGAYRRAPDLDTLRFLCSEAELERGMILIEFECRPGDVLLSRYGPWGEFLDVLLEDRSGATKIPEKAAALEAAIFDVHEEINAEWGEYNCRDIQAAVPSIEESQIRRITPIDLSTREIVYKDFARSDW